MTASKSFALLTTKTKTLRSAMRNSTVWIYELFAKEIGEDKALDDLQANRTMATPILLDK